MRAIGGQHVRAHHQDANRGDRFLRPWQVLDLGDDLVARQIGVIKRHIGIDDRRRRLGLAPFRIGGIAADQKADHRRHIVVRAAQPVLHRQEPGAQVLRLARHEAQDLRQPAQDLHLLFAEFADLVFEPRSFFSSFIGPRRVSTCRARPSASAARSRVGDDADHRVARVAAGLQIGQDRLMCSSRNRRLAMTMSAWRTASRASSSACGFSPHSAAAWTDRQPREIAPPDRSVARAAGPAAWLSSVTIATR
jgi:hypothetical protein